jgi:hypothetical protein
MVYVKVCRNVIVDTIAIWDVTFKASRWKTFSFDKTHLFVDPSLSSPFNLYVTAQDIRMTFAFVD